MNWTPHTQICGIDEAGRGSLAGSLFVCGVVLCASFPRYFLSFLRDSKQIKPKERFFLAHLLLSHSRYCIIQKDSSQIDSKGLSLCLQESLQEIVALLEARYYLFDGNTNFGICGIEPIIKGDQKNFNISAASILAKVCKDCEMINAHERFGQYNFWANKGYGTKDHRARLQKFGPCPIHRKSFRLSYEAC